MPAMVPGLCQMLKIFHSTAMHLGQSLLCFNHYRIFGELWLNKWRTVVAYLDHDRIVLRVCSSRFQIVGKFPCSKFLHFVHSYSPLQNFYTKLDWWVVSMPFLPTMNFSLQKYTFSKSTKFCSCENIWLYKAWKHCRHTKSNCAYLEHVDDKCQCMKESF